METFLDRGRDPVGSLAGLEAATLTATRQMLGELTGTEVRAASPRRFAGGEVRRVRSLCTSSVARQVQPGPHWELSPKGAELARGCLWGAEGGYDRLEVHAEAAAPSRTIDQSATTAARNIYEYTGSRFARDVEGLGDEADIDTSSFDGGERRSVLLVARKRNLVVTVDLSRDGHPAKKPMERDAIRVARDVLAAHR